MPVYLTNRVPSPLNSNKTPFQILYKTSPNISLIKVFGFLCYALTLESHHHKCDPRTRHRIFLGFQNGTKGYLVFDIDNNVVIVSRHVLFSEIQFPFQQHSFLT